MKLLFLFAFVGSVFAVWDKKYKWEQDYFDYYFHRFSFKTTGVGKTLFWSPERPNGSPIQYSVSNSFTGYWSKQRFGSNKWDYIGGNGNCTVRKEYMGRLTSCNQVFELQRARFNDSGVYRVRLKYQNGSEEVLTVHFNVVRLSPTLTVQKISGHALLLACVDRGDPRASTYIYYDGYQKGGPRTGNFWTSVQLDYSAFMMRNEAQRKSLGVFCKSVLFGYAVVSSSSYVMASPKLYTGDFVDNNKFIRNKNDCGPWKGPRHHEKDKGFTSFLPPKAPSFGSGWERHIDDTVGTSELCTSVFCNVSKENLVCWACWGRNFTFYSVFKNASWSKTKEFAPIRGGEAGFHKIGDNGNCTDERFRGCGTTLKLLSVQHADAGVYHVTKGKNRFNVTLFIAEPILPTLRFLGNSAGVYRFKCEVNPGAFGVNSTWQVQGIFDHYSVDDKGILSFWPDCRCSIDLQTRSSRFRSGLI
ncbi:protein 105R [Lizard adenovirus 2]|uniref:Protein 105R n=1 Tax=Lizard adenovirus 2 TaxID=874272 RepID=A0A076FUN7_9ADEN|nr:protein 105R [Lizard adenovirus 2]AII22589.1 protein 105R [Lizard adenovirus 2]